uniref:Uncharacterized protein n=1 Tax=Anguilla anguilla TaxID=7936 RepID=A0A0E9S7S5_ANGAN
MYLRYNISSKTLELKQHKYRSPCISC